MFEVKKTQTPKSVELGSHQELKEELKQMNVAKNGQKEYFIRLDLNEVIDPVETLYLHMIDSGTSADGRGYVAEVINMGAIRDPQKASSVGQIEAYKECVGPEMSISKLQDVMLAHNFVGQPSFSAVEISADEWNHAKVLESRALASARYAIGLKHENKPYLDIRPEEMVELSAVRTSMMKSNHERPQYEDITEEDMRELDPVRFSENSIRLDKHLEKSTITNAINFYKSLRR